MMRSNTPADSPIGRPASGPFEVSEQDFRAAATRAETVGSLLRPGPVAEAVRADRGQPSEAVAKLLDDAVREAIRLQEQAGLDVITDGEMRRFSWAQTPRYLDCFERRPDTATLDWRGGAGGPRPDPGMAFPAVVRPVREAAHTGEMASEYAFLASHAHTRTKYSMAAPSYHRRYWSPRYSAAAERKVTR